MANFWQRIFENGNIFGNIGFSLKMVIFGNIDFIVLAIRIISILLNF